jgi:CDP-glucose 4,6-dehydratase
VIANWGTGTWEGVRESARDRDKGRARRLAPLRLSSEKARETLGWAARWSFQEMIVHTVDWYRAYYAGDDMGGWCRRQIAAYMEPAEEAAG